MNPRDTDRQPREARAAAKKHVYGPPRLKELGQLHLHTQATGPGNGDGGQGMMAAQGGMGA